MANGLISIAKSLIRNFGRLTCNQQLSKSEKNFDVSLSHFTTGKYLGSIIANRFFSFLKLIHRNCAAAYAFLSVSLRSFPEKNAIGVDIGAPRYLSFLGRSFAITLQQG